ncbi:MAG: 2-C-methyl-D-erythritol 4-phosphate cytidylyltransferase [SAR202 cluster bacterium]|nr:2-C-methyl-D-erythritol 4-phosphate cytidylyltransferase [SAR202 cluster bacterium]
MANQEGTLGTAGAVIVAAGESRRMNGIDKVFAPVGGEPVIARAVAAFERAPEVAAIVVVVSPANFERMIEVARARKWRKVTKVVLGGARRQDSVARGLAALPPCDYVLVHDGARPLVSGRAIREGLAAAMETGAAIPTVPLKETVKVVDAQGFVVATPDRAGMGAVQTPQVFRRDLLERAHREIVEDVTDDAAMVERLGGRVRVFAGDNTNIKVTTPEDLAMAEALMGQQH